MQNTKERAITLIALVITIIILLILAGVSISALSDNGLFSKAKLAKEKYAISEAKEELELKITELTIEQQGKGENLEKEDFIKLNSEELEVKSTESYPIEIVYKGYVFNVNERFSVTYVGKAEGTIVTYTTEPDGYVKDGTTVLIKLKVTNSSGISKIQNPNGLENECNGKTSVAIDYEVTENGTYTFKIIDINGNETVKDIIIDKYDTEPGVIESEEIGISTQYKLKIKAKDELSGLKRITVIATITDDANKESTVQKSVTLSGEYEKEEEIDLGIKYNYTLTAYTIEVEDQAGNVATYEPTVTLPITNEVLRITTEEELRNFMMIVNTTYNTFAGKTVYLDADIELKQEWTSIVNAIKTSCGKFAGVFEGNNHTISGLCFNTTQFAGLFNTNKGTIQNLNVEINTTIGAGKVGVIAYDNRGTIKNCHVSGTIEATTIAGYVGGIVSGNYGMIENCSNKANMTGSGLRECGGIAGMSSSNGTIKNCYNEGNISGDFQLGGIVGYTPYETTIINCYNKGNISGKTIGGITGHGSKATINNCYSIGTVTGSSLGGISGTTIIDGSSNNYYLNTSATGGIKGADVEGVAESRTESEMKEAAFVTLLNAGEDNWKQVTNDYPILKWQ